MLISYKANGTTQIVYYMNLLVLFSVGLTLCESARRINMNFNTAKSVWRSYKRDGDVYADRRHGRPHKITEEVQIHHPNVNPE